jgi:putative FmdB family regulatory protein
MPTYEYECNPEDGCGYKFEEIQKMSDEPKKKCPKCKKNKLKRLISRTGIIFKGTGWTPKSGSEI